MNEEVHATVDGCGVAWEREREVESNNQGREGNSGPALARRREMPGDAERDGERETEAHSTLPR